MKRIRYLYLVNSIMTSCALFIVMASIFILLETIKSPAYGLTKEYVSITVRKEQPITDKEVTLIKNKLYEIISNHRNIVIIKYDNMVRELYLYDPIGYFNSEEIIEGEYFNEEDFELNDSLIMVEENSSVYQIMENGVTLIRGKDRGVKGVYTTKHPLSSSSTEYDSISNLFSVVDLRGTYYFDSFDSLVIDEIIGVFKSEGYMININKKELVSDVFFREILNNSVYIPLFLGVMFIYFSNYFTYFLVLAKNRKIFELHWSCGATKLQLLLQMICAKVPIIVFGTCIGIIVGQLILKNKLRYPVTTFCTSFILNVIITLLLFTNAYYRQPIWGKLGEG